MFIGVDSLWVSISLDIVRRYKDKRTCRLKWFRLLVMNEIKFVGKYVVTTTAWLGSFESPLND